MRHDNNIWTRRDGTQVQWRDMGLGHLENCVGMLRRGANRAIHEAMAGAGVGSYVRGEMAQDALDEEMDRQFARADNLKAQADRMERYLAERVEAELRGLG